MKYQLFTYRRSGGLYGSGMVVQDRWFDLSCAAAQVGLLNLPPTVDGLVENWENVRTQLQNLAFDIVSGVMDFSSHTVDPQALVLASPLCRPGVIYGAGANYLDHVVAMSRAFNMNLALDPKSEGVPPWHFIKAGRSNILAHGGEIPFPANTMKLDWEAELAVVIGRHARRVNVETALDYVAGYMCANDLSARDHLVRGAVDVSSPFRFDWIGHKCFEGSCPLGPVFTPAEFVESPEKLSIRLWLNGDLRQDSNTSNHLYSVAEQIAHLSARMDLYPGDVILTGTPAGVGMETGTFLKPGDTMCVEISGLGRLVNKVVMTTK